MALATIVGAAAGLAAILFSGMIDGVDWLFFDVIHDDWLGGLPRAKLILLPALGALLVGPITLLLAPEARGHGVPEVMLAMETGAARIRPTAPLAKAATAALTIGSGGSAGKQGPIVLLGSSFGSAIGDALRLSEENRRLLVASGAAAGIAATFNAPIAGVFFALEVVLRNFSTRNFSVVVLAAVSATVVAASITGDDPIIPVPQYELESALEMPLYLLLGAACGAIGIVFIRALYWSEDRFSELPWPPLILMPVLGGLLVGALGLIDSGILGTHLDAVNESLVGSMTMQTLLLLVVLKLVATAITLGSGGSGGVFFPSLFIGAMVGGAYGEIAHGLFPDMTATSGAYATVGMAALFAGTARAPITAVLILFELTRDYEIMVPLMAAVAASTVVSQLLSSGSIYTIKLQRRGIHIDEEREPDNVMQSLRVSDAMSPVRVSVSEETPVSEIARALGGDPETSALVLSDAGELLGVVTNVDLNEAISRYDADHLDEHSAAEICTREIHTVFPDQTLHDALAVFANRSMHALPVVSRDGDGRPQGMLRRSDITQAYAQHIEARAAGRQRQRLAATTASDDVRYLELRVSRESGLAGRALSEWALTSDAVIVAVRHDGVTLIPRGHTRLSVGDRVTVITSASAADEVRAIFEGKTP